MLYSIRCLMCCDIVRRTAHFKQDHETLEIVRFLITPLGQMVDVIETDSSFGMLCWISILSVDSGLWVSIPDLFHC